MASSMSEVAAEGRELYENHVALLKYELVDAATRVFADDEFGYGATAAAIPAIEAAVAAIRKVGR
jgi:hypothetical protein